MAQNILDALRDKGVLSEDVHEKLASFFPEHTRAKLSELFQRYQQLNEDEKKELMSSLADRLKETLHNKAFNNTSWYTEFFYARPYTVFFVAILLVLFVLVFFIYKLFKCLSERQTKREEKKKNKQMKKKK